MILHELLVELEKRYPSRRVRVSLDLDSFHCAKSYADGAWCVMLHVRDSRTCTTGVKLRELKVEYSHFGARSPEELLDWLAEACPLEC